MNYKKVAKSELPENDKLLINSASNARKLSYSPYSKLKVGSALLLSNGEIVQGANIENASYPLSMCAERTAMYNAKINHAKEEVLKIAITASNQEDNINTYISPCGACRQVLLEQENNQENNIQVFLTSENIDYVLVLETWREFLPLSFDKDILLTE